MNFLGLISFLVFVALLIGGGLWAIRHSITREEEDERKIFKYGGWVAIALGVFITLGVLNSYGKIDAPNPLSAPEAEISSVPAERAEPRAPTFEEDTTPSEMEKAREDQRKSVDEFTEHTSKDDATDE